MEVSFVPDEEDGREEMIEHLNPTELDPEDKVLYWDVKIDNANSETAVNSTYGQFILDVTNENKNDIEDFRYKVTADENGVKLEQIIGNDSISHKNIAWSDFVNTATGEPFKFTDWGEENSENPQSQTFDNSATYVYKDTEGDSKMRTPLVFSFTVADEASKEAIINGLNLEVEYNGVSSPVTMAAVEPYSYYARLTDGASAWTTQKLSNFHFQRDDLGRNFDDAVSPMTGTIVRTSHSGTPTDSSATTVDTYTHADVMREAYVEKTVRTYKMEATTDENGLNQGETHDELTWTPTYKAVLDSTDTSKVTLGSQTSIDDETYPYSASDRWSDDTLTFTVTTYTRKGNGEVQLYTQNDNDTNFTARDNSVNDLFEKHARATDPSQQTGNLGEDYCRYTSTSLSGSGAKYIDIGDTMLQEKRYDQKYYTYSYNATGGKSNLMAGTSGSFLDTTSGIYSYELQGTIAGENKEDYIYLTNSDGSLSRYDTNLLCGRTIELRTTANSSAYGANVSIMNIWYDDRLDHPDRSGNNDSTNIKITMPDEATVRFSKQRASKGSSLESHFKIEVPPPPEKLLHIQSGSQPWQSIDLIWRGMSLSSIGLGGANVTTYDKAQRTMAMADAATDIVSSARANFGAYQNRLEHAYDIDNNTSENTSYAESRIRDTDMAKEMVNYSKHSILEQAGLSVLSQANSANQGVISLLG
jgi:flagellin-like hook-associated protein FlgL